MSEHVFICRVISKPEGINFIISSKHTYLRAMLICSLITDQKTIFSYNSEQFDLYEGEQLLLVRHSFSQLIVRGTMLTVDLIDQNGERVDRQSIFLQNEVEKNYVPLIETKGNICRVTNGGRITIELAGVAFGIYAHYNDVLEQLQTYITNRESDCDVSVEMEDILKEKEKADKTYKYPPTISEIELYALRKRVSESILNYNCFQIHGAAFAVDKCGYIFTADSGIGKTTHMRLWMNNLNNAYVVNGDQPLVKVGTEVMVCGSPWCGKEGWNKNVEVPLKAIVIMERSKANSIIEISMSEALVELLRQVHRPSDSAQMKMTLQLLSLLEGRIKFYRFMFNNFAEDAFSVSYNKIHLGQ